MCVSFVVPKGGCFQRELKERHQGWFRVKVLCIPSFLIKAKHSVMLQG